MDRTTNELYGLGLRNSDVRVYNCAWNPETRRVFHFDFDQATMAEWEAEEASVVQAEEHEVVVKEDDDAQEAVQQEDELKGGQSPLLKRSLNTLEGGPPANDAVQTKKMKEGREYDTQVTA